MGRIVPTAFGMVTVHAENLVLVLRPATALEFPQQGVLAVLPKTLPMSPAVVADMVETEKGHVGFPATSTDPSIRIEKILAELVASQALIWGGGPFGVRGHVPLLNRVRSFRVRGDPSSSECVDPITMYRTPLPRLRLGLGFAYRVCHATGVGFSAPALTACAEGLV